jgi:hypothetical protein
MGSYNNVWMDQRPNKTPWKAYWKALWDLQYSPKKIGYGLLVAHVTNSNSKNVPNFWHKPMIWTLEHHKKGSLRAILFIEPFMKWGIYFMGPIKPMEK